ncbi:sugar 3,4-ketoisomerase [Elizabethkingia meningoseptica]|uniref:sugar 3,4-ketoisomerase n=1 Tax=Elizabethkingia meningoseptica TaxID=238 RepID=UPI0020121CE9|nr:FdtA/QdtA family cupin domain-containing protein [Elizabethkingia meningoseptica]MCL1675702.1 FdtA/QdtA family cupin domain-containing protein [Elizabethkingia meningoseptica]MCL1686882.1 FdtA/QdtA family cupin domain-containing protein [Elizabethkingia meningoseptica]
MDNTIYSKPQIIIFDKIGSSELGYITIAETQKNVPFDIKRVYWTYYTPQDVIRGGHAHKDLQQIIFAVSGTITFNTEDKEGYCEKFVLDHPSKGLYLPKLVWREIHFTHNAVLLCVASEYYIEDDYLREYNLYLDYIKNGEI